MESWFKQVNWTDPNVRTLALKICEAQIEIGGLPKEGKANLGQYSYQYTTEDQILSAIRAQLLPKGVAVFVSFVDHVREDNRIERRGQYEVVNLCYRLRLEVCFVDTETGANIVITSQNMGSDPADKAINKAQTAAMRTLFLKQFMAMGEDEPEEEEAPVYGQRQVPQVERANEGQRTEILRLARQIYGNRAASQLKLPKGKKLHEISYKEAEDTLTDLRAKSAPAQSGAPQQQPQEPAQKVASSYHPKITTGSWRKVVLDNCEHFGWAVDDKGRAVPNHIFNVLNREGFTPDVISDENVGEAWNVIQLHYGDIGAEPADGTK